MNTAWRHSFPLPSLFEAPLRIGENRFKALCPAHLETHASCVVNYHRSHGWRWHCFACNADGDALDVLTLRGMAVREALEQLSDNVGNHKPVMSLDKGNFGGTARDAAGSETPSTVRRESVELICDACRDEHATFSPVEYRHSTSTALLEASLSGWEIAAGVNACVGPRCLERLAPEDARSVRGTAYAA